MITDEILDGQVYFVNVDAVLGADEIGQGGAASVDLDASLPYVVLGIATRAEASVADELVDS